MRRRGRKGSEVGCSSTTAKKEGGLLSRLQRHHRLAVLAHSPRKLQWGACVVGDTTLRDVRAGVGGGNTAPVRSGRMVIVDRIFLFVLLKVGNLKFAGSDLVRSEDPPMWPFKQASEWARVRSVSPPNCPVPCYASHTTALALSHKMVMS